MNNNTGAMKKVKKAKKEKNHLETKIQDKTLENQIPEKDVFDEKIKEREEPSPETAKEEELESVRGDKDFEEKLNETGAESCEEEKIAAAEAKATEMQDRYLRLRAEFENYKKRMMREKNERMKYFNLEFIKELLPSLDNLERAIVHASEEETENGSMLEGLEMVYKSLQESFSKYGVTRIESLGNEFDPNCHQAVGMVESNETPDNHIVEECQTGYFLHDRIIRPAMVRVSGKA